MTTKVKTGGYFWGTGRRKKSVARVRIKEGNGQFLINDRPVDDYFTQLCDQNQIQAPLQVVDQVGKLDVFVNVHGGGFAGQAGAVVQGLARALKTMYEAQEPEPAETEGEEGAEGEAAAEHSNVKKLKDSGLLTRDARMKERKKYGRRGARRSFQFSKR